MIYINWRNSQNWNVHLEYFLKFNNTVHVVQTSFVINRSSDIYMYFFENIPKLRKMLHMSYDFKFVLESIPV